MKVEKLLVESSLLFLLHLATERLSSRFPTSLYTLMRGLRLKINSLLPADHPPPQPHLLSVTHVVAVEIIHRSEAVGHGFERRRAMTLQKQVSSHHANTPN